jgi:[acyl-carrier-protein] S-malonyltransferase
VRQLTAQVRWTASVERLIGDGFVRFVEVGPGKALAGMVRQIDRTVEVRGVEKPEDLDAFAADADREDLVT